MGPMEKIFGRLGLFIAMTALVLVAVLGAPTHHNGDSWDENESLVQSGDILLKTLQELKRESPQCFYLANFLKEDLKHCGKSDLAADEEQCLKDGEKQWSKYGCAQHGSLSNIRKQLLEYEANWDSWDENESLVQSGDILSKTLQELKRESPQCFYLAKFLKENLKHCGKSDLAAD